MFNRSVKFSFVIWYSVKRDISEDSHFKSAQLSKMTGDEDFSSNDMILAMFMWKRLKKSLSEDAVNVFADEEDATNAVILLIQQKQHSSWRGCVKATVLVRTPPCETISRWSVARAVWFCELNREASIWPIILPDYLTGVCHYKQCDWLRHLSGNVRNGPLEITGGGIFFFWRGGGGGGGATSFARFFFAYRYRYLPSENHTCVLHVPFIELSLAYTKHLVSAGSSFYWLVLPFRERNNFIRLKLTTHSCIVFTDFQHTKLYPFQNLSLGFILIIFLKFCKFQPRYSYKIYFYKMSATESRIIINN